MSTYVELCAEPELTRAGLSVLERLDLRGVVKLDWKRDPRTGLYTGAYLERWTRGLGAGTLPIGLVLLRVFGVG